MPERFRPEKGFVRVIVMLALPMLLQNMISFLVGFADNVMVGTMGEASISGVYLGNQVQNLLNSLMLGVTEGTMVLAAQYWGRHDTASIRTITSIAIRIGMGIGAAFWLAVLIAPRPILSLLTSDPEVIAEGLVYTRYLCWSFLFFAASQTLLLAMRSVEVVKIGMYASSIALVFNISLNWILIFGKFGAPALGLKGAAIATLISRVVEFCVSFFYVFFRDRVLRLRFRDLLHTSRKLRLDLLRVGAPVFAGQLIWGLNVTVQSGLIGHLGAEATSAVSITSMFFQLIISILAAVRVAVAIQTGKAIGEGRIDDLKQNARFVQVMFLGFGFLFCGLILVLREPMLMLYHVSDATKEIARQFMLILAVCIVGTSYQGMCLNCLVKAGGDTSFVFINDTIFVWGIVIPSAILSIYVFHAPVWVTYACLKADELLKVPVAFIKINRFRWIRSLTRSREELQ